MDISSKNDIKYLGRDFIGIRKSLIDLAKVYYPDTYNDFNESSIGMMFIEMVSMIGDVLSYYTDASLKESLLYYATNRSNIINLAYTLGYKYKVTTPSTCKLTFFQIIPSTTVNGNNVIDTKYALKIGANTIIGSEKDSSLVFRTVTPVDFSIKDSDNYNVVPFETNGENVVSYMIQKEVDIVSGTIKSYSFDVGDPTSYAYFSLPDNNVIEILNVKDSDGNIWYEVDYLAQDSIMSEQENIYFTDFSKDRSTVPYILKIKSVPKRFVKKINEFGITELHFGSGVSIFGDQTLTPNLQVPNFSNIPSVINKINFLSTNTYGQTPANTTLIVTYTVGGGSSSNCNQGEITTIYDLKLLNDTYDYNSQERSLFETVKSSLRIVNETPAIGGRGSETTEEIRQNAISFFNAQDRCVTLNDYTIRALSLPATFGSISRCYSRKNSDNFTIDLYCLGMNRDFRFVKLNNTIKENLKTYLSYYSDVNTVVIIKDAYVINIGVEFDIISNINANKDQTILECISVIKSYFNPDTWQINQPIVLSDLYSLLDKVSGVRTVSDIRIINKYSASSNDTLYSNLVYDINRATIDGIIYPAIDPMIFELTYPNSDIKGSSK